MDRDEKLHLCREVLDSIDNGIKLGVPDIFEIARDLGAKLPGIRLRITPHPSQVVLTTRKGRYLFGRVDHSTSPPTAIPMSDESLDAAVAAMREEVQRYQDHLSPPIWLNRQKLMRLIKWEKSNVNYHMDKNGFPRPYMRDGRQEWLLDEVNRWRRSRRADELSDQ